MNKFFKILIILALIMGYQNLSAADVSYYVSVYGSNSNLGTETSPWRTIQYAVNQCTNSDNDYTIYVAANPIINQNGSGKEYYNENITIGGEGVNFKSLTIIGPEMEHPPSDFWYDENTDNVVILEKARIHGSITIQKSNVTIENLRIFNTQATSSTNLISIASGVSNVMIETCYIGPLCNTTLTYGFMQKNYNNQWVWAWVPNGGLNQYYEPWEYENDFQPAGKHGIYIEGDGYETSNITIQNSMIYYISGEGEGIYLKAPKADETSASVISNVLLSNNYIMLNRRSGIVAAGEISGLTLEDNTISLNGWYNDYFGIEDDDNTVTAEYGNGLVLFDGGTNDVSKRSDINVKSSFYLNRSSGIYLFGGADNVTINNYSDFWDNKDGIFINYTTNEPGHPIGITSHYEKNDFTNIKINNNVIHSNRRFGIYYNAKQSDIKCIDAEKNYYDEPYYIYNGYETGWNGPSTSLGPKYAWGSVDNPTIDGGRDNTNSNSIVYGPVDINPYMSNLGTGALSNLKVDNSNTSNYFDNITNALRTLTSCSRDSIVVQGTSTNYSENITIPYA
ncbi:MAG: right-handed parallel beta-helix repeat-containing protein, partial [Candidatus Kapabacteria bacterium]|nr:right-handed parallel beta-helix repeat-containing protein [Candidatus Kapabacteria bacterium]